MLKYSAVFVGTARDCAAFLPQALARWDDLAPVFRSVSFIVAESDSQDATKAILEDWRQAGPHRRVLTLDGLGDPGWSRSQRLAFARNRLLDEIRGEVALKRADYLVVMDLDDASLAITAARLRACMASPGWDGLFANQLFYYNDVWALRHPRRSPDDFTHHLDAAPPGWRRRWARLRYLTWRNRPFWPFRSRLIPVESAFGGFAVYKMALALEASYSGFERGRDICEHVPFNRRLRAAGARLFIHPQLINMAPHRLTRAMEWWRARRSIAQPREGEP